MGYLQSARTRRAGRTLHGAVYSKPVQQMRPYLIAPPERTGYEIKRMGQMYAGEALTYP
jgi:hypothetical protein